jgi:hypothetical protein
MQLGFFFGGPGLISKIVLILAACSSASAAPVMRVVSSDIGEVRQFEKALAEFVVVNDSSDPLEIARVVPDRSTDVVTHAYSGPLAPGKSRAIAVLLDTEDDLGFKSHSFRVFVKGSQVEYRGRVRLFATSILENPRPSVDFGKVDSRSAMRIEKVRLKSDDVADLKITKILATPDFVHATIGADAREVDVALDPAVHWGDLLGTIKVALSTPNQPDAWIDVRADVHGEVASTANPYSLGVIRQGENHVFLIELSSRTGKPFSAGRPRIEGFTGSAAIKDCLPERVSCRLIQLTIPSEAKRGFVRGKIIVPLPDFSRELPIRMGGLIVSKDAQIKSLDSSQNGNQGQASRGASPGFDLESALRSAAEQVSRPSASSLPAVVPAGRGPLIKWAVANEKTVYGFVVHRGPSETGPFERINKRIVKVEHPDEKSEAFQYRDNSAEPGSTYWYYVGIVFNDGMKRQLTGPQKVVAK